MPSREHLRRLDRTWISQPIYFITLCVAHRRPILAQNIPAEILISSLHDASAVHGWIVGRYVIMPDHVHFFTTPGTDAKSLSAFIRDWKKWTTRQLHAVGIGMPVVWQAEFFDHVLRSAGSYNEKWHYVRENPIRAGLVSTVEAWPYSGECEVFRF
jgi:putative transposase